MLLTLLKTEPAAEEAARQRKGVVPLVWEICFYMYRHGALILRTGGRGGQLNFHTVSRGSPILNDLVHRFWIVPIGSIRKELDRWRLEQH